MKTVCIYHSIDLDGWMSAAIVKYWFIKNNKNYSITDISKQKDLIEKNKVSVGVGIIDFSSDNNIEFLDFIGYNYGQPIPDLSKYDKVIMCDVSYPNDEMNKLIDNSNNDNFIWIDHHISAISNSGIWENWAKGLRDVTFSACELTWQYLFPNEPMPEIVRLLGRYDCFGHKETDEEKKVLEFQYGARQCVSNYEEAYDFLIRSINKEKEIEIYGSTIEIPILLNGKAIYSYLCTEAKQAYENGFEILLGYKPGYRVESDPLIYGKYKFICINKERFNPINFEIDYHKDGYDGAACFYFDGKQWAFSLYNDNGEVDCSIIAKKYGGGGHKGAAGFRIDDINKIIKLN